MLRLKNVSVSVSGKNILKNVKMTIPQGSIIAIVGPNASGKSTLAKAIMGFPEYKIVRGKILFEGRDITTLPIEERVKLGITMVFQDPPAIKNVKLGTLLKYLKSKDYTQFLKDIGFHKTILDRDLNVSFSGGEKKVSEILQILALDPKLIILDELDSGLDANLLIKLNNFLIKWIRENKKSALFITHRSDALNLIKPDDTFVLTDGTVICHGDYNVIWDCIKKSGYKACAFCPVLRKIK